MNIRREFGSEAGTPRYPAEYKLDNDCTLQVSISRDTSRAVYYYDFMMQVMETGNRQVVPFSQLDSGILQLMREKLVKLGGKLPESDNAAPGPTLR